MPNALAVYTVLPDFEVGGTKGSDSIDWIETDDESVNMEQARRSDLIRAAGPLRASWSPYPARYVMKAKRFIPASFYEFGSFIAVSASGKEKLSSIKGIEWLALNPVHDTPPPLVAKDSPSFYVMRFAQSAIPHRSSKLMYFPGTKSIQEVVSLVLSKKDAEDLYAFRLEGDPVTHYATQKLVDICERDGLKGLEFTPIDCEFK